ncbi:FAD-linked oxidase C-terminal domain-containing protein [Candidatus Methylomirabilis sp.]|uniref:FAD-binding oxidoreductase n=1 Tax=Candidatus Methylomirabilis sp. TaxID=2032687 RepID=UPI003076495C
MASRYPAFADRSFMTLNPSFTQKIRGIVSGGKVFSEPGELSCYSYDATRMSFLPDLVVEPVSAGQVADVVRAARQERIPVVPRGAATCATGGPLPVSGGIVLSLTLMNRILEINPDSRSAVVEPGVVNGDLQAAVEPYALYFPPDPSSFRVSTIGGNIAECAGGPRCLKYGVTKDFVQGLEVVFPDGCMVDTGPHGFLRWPESALIGLMVGSEGTLGIVTKAYLKLLPMPTTTRSVVATMRTIGQVGEVVYEIFSAGLVPAKLEFMDGVAMRLVDDVYKMDLDREAAALLLIETDGDPQGVEEESAQIEAICRKVGASRVQIARSVHETGLLWRARSMLGPSVSRSADIKVNEDIVVPRGRLAEALQLIEELGQRHHLRVVSYGHAGDGNLHTSFLLDNDAEQKRQAEAAISELFRLVLRLGGSVSGEHGIGLTKVKYLAWETGESGVTAMRKVRDALNPGMSMNPYKIFMEPGADAIQRDQRLM